MLLKIEHMLLKIEHMLLKIDVWLLECLDDEVCLRWQLDTPGRVRVRVTWLGLGLVLGLRG